MGGRNLMVQALDPVRMAQTAGIVPDAWQARMLRSRAPRILLNCSRQSGKSTATGLLATHCAIHEPGSLVLLLSPSQRQSQELFRSCLQVYRALGRPVPPQTESALRLELENGSRIVSLPGHEQTIRGLAGVSLLAVDEASRVSDDLYVAIRPMLAVSNGRLIALSTPAGRRGWWYEAWESGGDEWERYHVRADQCARISKSFLEEERRNLGPSWFAQEYECAFTNAENAVFPESYLQRIITKEKHAWKIPPAPWAQPQDQQPGRSSRPESWTRQIEENKPKRDPRMNEYGFIPWEATI